MLKRRKTLIFQGFVELGIELKMGGRGVGTSDMPFLASGDLLQNVNHAPSLGEKIL